MAFNSFSFLAFYSIVLIFYYTIFRRRQNTLLLLASIVFYLFSGPQYIIYVLGTSYLIYVCALYIFNLYESWNGLECESAEVLKHRKAEDRKKASRRLKLALFILLAMFIFLRYFNFLSQSFADFLSIFHIKASPFFLHIIVPLGLSYYTFTNISYLLDVYWRRIPAERDFHRFLLFTIYFPHIVQGPISRYGQLTSQFKGNKKFSQEQVTSGLWLMLWGYFKKMVIADRLNLFVSQVYNNYEEVSGSLLLVATVLFSIQIYADFSGHMDIVGGASETFGIKLEKNFNHPYFSKTIPEFWRRWHITLGAWFKDYLYYPISNSSWMKRSSRDIRQKKGAAASRIYMSCIPTLIVWITTGIWHGAAWNYVLWGLFHAVLMVSGIIFAEPVGKLTKQLKINTEVFSWSLFQMLRTFLLCCIGRVFFRAGNVTVAFSIFYRIITKFSLWELFDGSLFKYGLDGANFILALLAVGVLLVVSILQEKISLRCAFAKQNLVFRWSILYIAIYSVLIFGIYGPGYEASAFIYNQF